MKRMFFVIFAVMFLVALTNETNSQDVKNKQQINTVCPVSGESIDDAILYEYKGKTYAVCCNSCLRKITKDPEKYISRLSDDGKSLKKTQK